MGIWKGHRTASRPPGKINMWLNTARRLMIRENPYFNVCKLIPCRNMNARRPGAPLAYHFLLSWDTRVRCLSPDYHPSPYHTVTFTIQQKKNRNHVYTETPLLSDADDTHPVGPSVLSAGCQPQTLSNIGCFGE